MMKKDSEKASIDYSGLSLELGDLLAKLQQPGIQVDEAIKMYEKGIQLIEQLETHLEKAENRIEQLKLAASEMQAKAAEEK